MTGSTTTASTLSGRVAKRFDEFLSTQIEAEKWTGCRIPCGVPRVRFVTFFVLF